MAITALTSVEVDALVVAKMATHHATCASGHSWATGQLLGLEMTTMKEGHPSSAATLHITNAIPSAAQPDAPENQSYAVDYLRSLRRVNYDVNVVGWYQTSSSASTCPLWTAPFIQTQFEYQKLSPLSVVLIYDTSCIEGMSIQAFRLTDAFMTAYEEMSSAGKISSSFTMASLAKFHLTPAQIFHSIPVSITNSDLAHAFLVNAVSTDVLTAAQAAPLDFNSTLVLEERLESISEAIDELGQDAWRYQGWQRSFNKEQQRIASTVYKRKQENAVKSAMGADPIWGDADLVLDSPHLAKIKGNEPSRLDPMLLDNQIRASCDSIHEYATSSLSKMYAAQCLGYSPSSTSAPSSS